MCVCVYGVMQELGSMLCVFALCSVGVCVAY